MMNARHIGPLVIALLLSLLGTACPTGEGEGVVVGRFYVLGCDDAYNYGSRNEPALFDMRANFFVGEPIIDDTAINPTHRLDLRIQRGGNNLEDSDSLYIQIKDVVAVAEQFSAGQGTPVGPEQNVNAALLLYVTCPTFFGQLDAAIPASGAGCPSLDATALDDLCTQVDYNAQLDPDADFPPFGPQDSCILFCRFGDARRGEPVKSDFKIDFGDIVRGIFSFNLRDHRTLQSGVEVCEDGFDNDEDGETDEADCELSPGYGSLRGVFNLEVRRGQVAQEFP